MQAYLDRFEGEMAVLLAEDESQIILPKKYLPPEADEGMYLACTFLVDKEATKAAEDEAFDLLGL